MITVEQCIRELLFEQDCVIIPDFGGFITKYKSAVIDHLGQVIYPPTKSVSFNRQLRNDDGLLTNTFAQLNAVSFVDASVAVREYVRNFSTILNRDNSNTLDRIGVFTKNESGIISFEFFTAENYLSESYGLRAVSAIAIQRGQVSDETINQLEYAGNSDAIINHASAVDDFEHQNPEERKSNKSLIVIFCLSLLLLLSSALPFTEINASQLNLNEAGVFRLVSELIASDKEVNISPIAIDGTISGGVSTSSQMAIDKPVFVDAPKTEEPKVAVNTDSGNATKKSVKYLVVAGVFREQANAERLYNNLSQQNLGVIVTQVKRGKVSYIGFDGGFSESEATIIMNKVKHQSIECWVKKI